MTFLLILLQLFFLLFSLYIGLKFFWLYHAAYWKRRGIASPDGKLFSGNLDQMFWEKPLRLFQLHKWTEQFGKVYGLLTGWQKMLVVSDPAMVHEVLTTKFDYFHGRMISTLAGDVDTDPRMHLFNARVSNLKKIMPTMDDSIKVAIELIEEERQKQPDAPINLHRFFVEMTFDVIARVAMGQRESMQFRSEDAKLSVIAFQRFQNNWFEYLSSICPWLGTHVIRPFILIREAVAQRQRIREARRSLGNTENNEQRPVDFIDLFLDSVTDQENIVFKNQLGVFNKAAVKIDRTNTVEEIGMQLQLFLLAGFDTTANSLGFVSYNLACHPTVQLKAQEEIDTVCLNEDATYEELNRLKYTDAVIKETLRLLPIAGIVTTRLCTETTTLGKELTVNNGTGVAIDVYSVHRNKELWGEDAEEFRPERWLDPDRPPASAHFYGFEEKMALVRLLRRYSLVKTEETERELKYNAQVVLNPGAVMVRLDRHLEESGRYDGILPV
uniref:Cytochrome P450 n=1 Tax=Globodera rostochiensis TaxID=31243 RepID=A0A914IEG0_GLORO